MAVNATWTAVQGIMSKKITFNTKCTMTDFTDVDLGEK